MLVRKRYIVQKSFRIDEEVERDLATLAEMTGKSQNDLVNAAIIEMLQDNKSNFIQLAAYEHFMWEFEMAEGVLKPFEMGGLRVEVSLIGDGSVAVRHIVSNCDGDVGEDYTKKFESSVSEDFDNYLKELGGYIDPQSEDSQKYLNNRLNYSEYVKIRK